jgi:hypothetical protein
VDCGGQCGSEKHAFQRPQAEPLLQFPHRRTRPQLVNRVTMPQRRKEEGPQIMRISTDLDYGGMATKRHKREKKEMGARDERL